MNEPPIKKNFYSYQQVTPPSCGISQCLLGDNVRYDGKHKKHIPINQYLNHALQFVALCPEVAAGFGVPRPAMQLIQTNSTQVVQVNNPSINLTTTLQSSCHELVNTLPSVYGFIVKARSPSCANGSAPLFFEGNKTKQTTDGLLVSTIKKHLPWVFIREEKDLLTKKQCLKFAALLRFSQELFYAEQHNHLDDVAKHYAIDIDCPVKEWLTGHQSKQ